MLTHWLPSWPVKVPVVYSSLVQQMVLPDHLLTTVGQYNVTHKKRQGSKSYPAVVGRIQLLLCRQRTRDEINVSMAFHADLAESCRFSENLYRMIL